MADDVTITVRVNNATGPGITSVNHTINQMANQAKKGDGAFKDLKATLLSLAPAAVPVAAALAPIAVHAGAAGLAVAAFGAAVIPQIANLKDASAAQTKYTDAVTKYGANSQQAVQAQKLVADTLAGMPQATQRASAAFSNLQGTFKRFSDSTAKFTMVPVEHSFAVLGAIIPKLTPMVEGTSTQLDRLMKVAGGAVNSSGFDTLSKKVSDFANQTLKNATDGAIHFIRVMSEGNASGPMQSFFEYARKQGPAVKELLSNLMQALGNIAQGAADAGPGLLTVVNAFAKLVASVPPELIGNLMQVYAAFKLIKLAGAGIGAAAGGITSLRASIVGLSAASAAAGGGVAGLRAAFMSLGTAAKATVLVAGIAAVVLVLSKLSSMGKKAPPDVDRMTTALANLGRTGKVSGEALRSYGEDLGGLADSLRTLSRPSNLDKTQQFLTSLVGMDSTPVKMAKEDFDAVDKSLASLVKGGNADLAKQALEDTIKSLKKQGFTSKEVTSQLDDYKSALADQALEQKLAAESQGLFGQAAQATAAKLGAQKASADGLRQSIQALNDVNRSAYDAETKFESAISTANSAIKTNGRTLDVTTEKGRANRDALSALGAATDDLAAKKREEGASWSAVEKVYDRGRSKLIAAAMAMGDTKAEAERLANQILKTPSKTAFLKGNMQDLQAKLAAAKKLLKSVPNSRKAQVRADIYDLIHKIAVARAALNQLNNKTVTVTTVYQQVRNKGYSGNSATGGHASGGLITGPGSGTSDSIPALLSNGEFVVNAAATGRNRSLLEAVNSGVVQRFAKGGLSQGMKDARASLRDQFGTSHFGVKAGYQRSPFEKALGAPSDLGSLVSALNAARGDIKRATSGGTEKRLLHALDSAGKGLIKYEKSLTKVNASLEKAKSKLDDLKNSAAQLRDSVKSNIIGSANITRAAGGDGHVTVQGVMGGLIEGRDKAQSFSGALKALQKKGLSKDLLQQIAEAGIEGGGLETAEALMGASKSEIKSMNGLQSQIGKAATSAGKTTADAVYGASIKAQEKLVKSLEKQQAKLEKAMDKLAKVMEKVIAKAIGKKAAGGIVGAAASGGLRGGLTMVGEHGFELLDLPAGSRVWSNPDSRRKLAAQPAWASMLNVPRDRTTGTRRTAHASGAGGVQPVIVHQTITLDGKVVARQIFDPLRGEARARGVSFGGS